MRKCSNIFTWIDAISSTVISFIYLCYGITTINFVSDSYGAIHTQLIVEPTPWWIWLIFALIVFLRMTFLFSRSTFLLLRRKVAIGVGTLVCCSLVGGILTLCIPEDQLG